MYMSTTEVEILKLLIQTAREARAHYDMYPSEEARVHMKTYETRLQKYMTKHGI